MGALHAGHTALIRRAAEIARQRGLPGGAVATVFVNPTQFNEQTDFDRYPRDLENDLAACEAAGASGVFAPGPEVVYPPNEPVPVPPLPAVATEPGLEDRWRPGHFAGVAQVVLRLFELTRPAAAVFGEKDWQQLQLVREVAPLAASRPEIVAAPTVREEDGLAMSSRNRLLSAGERRAARGVPEALRAARLEPTPEAAEARLREVLGAHGLRVEYAAVRDAQTLLAPAAGRPLRALVAVRCGSVRLIDNAPWPGGVEERAGADAAETPPRGSGGL